MLLLLLCFFFFFFNDTATTEIYTLSLHDALPICGPPPPARTRGCRARTSRPDSAGAGSRSDRKSTRLNSSHLVISYAVFCLKKKKKKTHQPTRNVILHAQRDLSATSYQPCRALDQ